MYLEKILGMRIRIATPQKTVPWYLHIALRAVDAVHIGKNKEQVS
jgi:hypothetical protein